MTMTTIATTAVSDCICILTKANDYVGCNGSLHLTECVMRYRHLRQATVP